MRRVVITLIATVFLVGCSTGASPAGSSGQTEFDGVVKIGATLSLTGNFAQDAGPVHDGYQFWVDKANAAGGIEVDGKHYEVQLVVQDDGSDRDQAVRIVENLITQEEVNFLLAPWGSGNTDAVANIAERYKIPMIAPLAASDAVWTRGRQYLFGILPEGSESERPAIQLAKDLGVETMSLAYTDDLFPDLSAQGARDEAQKLGINIVMDEVYPPATLDLGSLVTKLQQANADLVVATADTADAILLVRQMKERGYFPKMLAMAGPPLDSGFLSDLGSDADYIVGVTWWTDKLTTSDPLFGNAKDFSAEFYRQFGRLPVHDEVASATAGLVLQMAIENAGSLDPTAVRDALASFNADTAFGHVSFDPTGYNSGTTTYAVQIQDGQIVYVYPDQVRDADAIYPAVGWDGRG